MKAPTLQTMLLPKFGWAASWTACILSISLQTLATAQHDHGNSSGDTEAAAPPVVFLDKSPRIVEYQLGRLSNQQLQLVETRTDDKKYIPVFTAILSRVGMSPAARESALDGLIAINDSNAVIEVGAALSALKGDDTNAKRTIDGLARILLAQPAEDLLANQAVLIELARSDSEVLASVGCAGLIAAGESDQARKLVKEAGNELSWLQGIPLVPDGGLRGKLHADALAIADSDGPFPLRAAAIEALASMPTGGSQTFEHLAKLIDTPELQPVIFPALLAIAKQDRSPEVTVELVDWLVKHAEATPAAARTEDTFLDAMQLVDQLLAATPRELARSYRNRLRETVVRVVRIHTVEEEMRYDIPYFAVEAGRPVQIVLVNEDLMPHNLVITTPGSLQQVAEDGLLAGPDGGLDGKQYVPQTDQVLFATNMIAARETERLTFTAPVEAGEYPFVCTFPRHWMRMYGVMVVVEDLDKWNQAPVEPKDPIGSNRSFVQSWTTADLSAELETGLQGRSPLIGKKLFTEATCASCHYAGDLQIGKVGPELNTLYSRWKSDRAGILREILEPSHKIDDKYAVQLLLTLDGDTVSGLVVAEDKETISILENPEAKEATVVEKSEIEERVRTSNSMMPKGLLDRYSKDEIFEIMGFIESIQTQP